ncbi:hypothetical protein APHWEB_1061 [Anaplasma phagocytophilum str. Webster]|nr:hypothetical protein APHWEB_1061 [Anaplasma phagocytophilum str. Webster]
MILGDENSLGKHNAGTLDMSLAACGTHFRGSDNLYKDANVPDNRAQDH